VTTYDLVGLVTDLAGHATSATVTVTVSGTGPPTIVLSGHPRPTAYQNTSLLAGQVVEAADCQFECPTSVMQAVRLAGGSGVRWHAGEVLGAWPPSTSWSTMHDVYGMLLKGAANLTIEDAVFFNQGDSISFDSLGNDGFLVRRCLIKYSRDDGLENDFYATGTIEDCFFDGVYDGVSCQGYASPPDGSGKLVTMRNCLVRLQPMDAAYSGPVPNHNGFWKWKTDAPRLQLYNNIFRADAASQEGPSVNMSLFPWPGKQADASGNVLCWLGAGAGPPGEAVPPGWTVLTGQAALDAWSTAVTNWNAAHPFAQADLHAPLCSLFSPGIVGSTTLTGPVTLMATAIDDRAVVGVQFKLDGASLGAEVLAPTPYPITIKTIVGADRFTKYQFPWDSRSMLNGTYTLTATARDTAGHATTSTPVTVTVAN
jgi:hypothetical protein